MHLNFLKKNIKQHLIQLLPHTNPHHGEESDRRILENVQLLISHQNNLRKIK